MFTVSGKQCSKFHAESVGTANYFFWQVGVSVSRLLLGNVFLTHSSAADMGQGRPQGATVELPSPRSSSHWPRPLQVTPGAAVESIFRGSRSFTVNRCGNFFKLRTDLLLPLAGHLATNDGRSSRPRAMLPQLLRYPRPRLPAIPPVGSIFRRALRLHHLLVLRAACLVVRATTLQADKHQPN